MTLFRWKTAQVALVSTLLFAAQAQAGGFEIPGIGSKSMSRGAAFVALADDLTALAINPGGLSRLSGTRLLYNHNLIWAPHSFTRAQTGMCEDADCGYGGLNKDKWPGNPNATSSNQNELFGLGAMLALSSDFGLEDWTFAIGIYGPNAFGGMKYPVNGGQRYMLTSMEMVLVYYTLGIAYGIDDLFGVGLTLQYAHLPVSKFGMVVDNAGPGVPSPNYSQTDLLAELDIADNFAFTANIGAWWRIIDALEWGFSARVVPVFLNPEGSVTVRKIPGIDFVNSETSSVELLNTKASLDITLPLTLRTGLRYRYVGDSGKEVFDIEADFVYEGWSSVKAFDVNLEGDVVVTPAAGAQPLPEAGLNDLKLDKRWKDTFSVRLGGTVQVLPDMLSLSLGGLWESGATPDQYSSLDFPSFDRYGVGGGLQAKFYGIELSVAYMHVFQEDRTVSEASGKVFQQRPLAPCPDACEEITGVPVNAGVFKTAYHQLNMSLALHFDEWF